MALAGLADLHHELAVHGEFEELAVLLAVAGEPDEIVAVDVDAVLALGPLVALAGAAPALQQVAGLVEHQHRRSGDAALGHGRILLGGALARRQRARPLDHPDAVEPVDRDAGDLPEDPVVRQRLRPQRVDLELGQAPARCILVHERLSGRRDTQPPLRSVSQHVSWFPPLLVTGAIRAFGPETRVSPGPKVYTGHHSGFRRSCYTA